MTESRNLLHHAEDADANVGFGFLEVLEEGLGFQHHLATRHGSIEQIGVTLLINDDNAIVRHV